MADPNQILMFLAMQAQAQQQQQQQAQQAQAQAQNQAQQQQKKLQAEMLKMAQKAAAAAAANQPSTSTKPSTSSATTSKPSTSSGTSRASRNGSQTMNANLLQQMAQVAQMGMLMAAAQQQQQQQQKQQQAQQKPKPQKAANGTPKKTTPTKASTSTANPNPSLPQMTPEQTLAYQAIQLQALQMMMSPKNLEDAMVKKMVDAAVKKAASSGAAAKASSSSAASTSSAGPSTSSQASTSSGASSAAVANGTANMVMQGLMLQAMAMQVQQQQKAQQAKETQKKADQAKKAKDAKDLAKQQQKEQDDKVKQQEQLMKFVLAQQQIQLQKKQQKRQEEHAAMAAKVLIAHKKALEGDDPEEMKKSLEAMHRLPLQMGWRRQTCVRSITAGGVKGDVSYFAPCGKKLSSYSETVRYLAKNGLNYITRDNFIFTTRYVIGEFVVPKQQETDDTRQEREFAMFTEDDVNKELARLIAIKFPPKVQIQPSTSSASSAPEEDVKVVIPKLEPPEEPLNLEDLNDEFSDEIMHSQMMSNGVDECKVRDRESDDLLVNFNDVRHLPEFSRIENQVLDAQGFADALMIHEFVQNFGHVLGIDLETTPKLEALCAGLAGDAEHADEFLQLTRQLLRLALEFPGMGNEKRFGQGGGEMGLDRENFSEVLRLFLIDKGRRGQEISTPLETQNFLSLTGEQKASILAFLCDELVCSRNVVTEIDRNLEEITRLKGEKWMREGKARALRQARSNKKKHDEKLIKEEAHHMETDSEPPTRPVTPKKNGVPTTVAATVSVSPQDKQAQLRKFTPGLGQCEVLTEQEESMTLGQMDGLIEDLHQEAQNINQKIHDTNQKIRSFPFGTDRFHRNYWMLAHTDTVLVESLESSGVNNPACTATEYASKDPPYLEDRVSEKACEGIDIDVIACVEDLVDEVVCQRARADKKMRKRYRRIENPMKRGWWTMKDKDAIESLRSCMLSRGIRERALHRLLTKPWFLNDLKFGTITLKKVIVPQDLELIGKQGWSRLNQAIDKLRTHMKMADVAKSEVSKPVVIPPSMALAQIVKDGIPWKTFEEDDVTSSESLEEPMIRQKIIETAQMVDGKFWRPKFRVQEGQESCQLFEDWKKFVMEEAATSSQLMVALQALEGMIMWERSSREALCQICKSMDGDEMLVCDGCDSGCHMECFRPRMTKVPEGDWFCQRCRQEKSGKPLCLFCTRETGHLHQCNRCAYHVHEECARDGPKETIKPETFICPHCQEIKQMRFVKRIMLRSESEERELEKEEKREAEKAAENAENAAKNGHSNGNPNGTPNGKGGALKRKLEPVTNGGMPRQMTKDLCVLMLDELVNQANSAPFLEPVNGKLVPGYKMVIAKPIDLRTIRQKNEKMIYETPEDFAEDVELMFANCRQFNIDHSDIGRAGMNLHKFFVKRWKQLKYNFTKRLRRINRQS